MENNFDQFILEWDNIVMIWAQIAFVIGIATLVIYGFLLLLKRNPAKKHEFISENEIRYLWYSGISICLSITFFINYHLVNDLDTISTFELTFKSLGSIAVGFLIGYAVNTYLNVYYPFVLSKRLHKLRFTPRLSPKTKKPMVLLDEESEDVHLTEEMIEDERISAFEYDVWYDEETGYKKIEKYQGSRLMQVCENCNYRTARENNEEIISKPTATEPGVLRKSYHCFYCNHTQTKDVSVAPIGK